MYLLIENVKDWREGMIVVTGKLIGTARVVPVENVIDELGIYTVDTKANVSAEVQADKADVSASA